LRHSPPRLTESATSALSLSELETAAEQWLLDGKLRNHSPRTSEARRELTEKLLWFLNEKGFARCGLEEVRGFLAHVQTGHEEPGGRWGNARMTRKVKPRTAETYFSNLSTFFLWCMEDGRLEASPMATLRAPVARNDQIQPFTEEHIRALLEATKRSRHHQRDTAILLLLLDTGLRASELCNLHYQDLDITGHRLTVVGKGNKRRSVYFGRETTRVLWGYMRKERVKNGGPLFSSERGEEMPLTRWGLLQLLTRLGEAAKLFGVRCSPHTCRHTYAVNFLRAGGSLFALKELLGHESLAMVNRYVKLAQADLEAQSRAHSPIDRMKRSLG
jgi:integrase/recombinase XerD